MRLLVLLLALLPMQVAALSCLPWSVEDAFLKAKDSPDSYRVLHGVMQFDGSALPQVDWNKQQNVPPETTIPARFSGHLLSRSGTMPFEGDLRIVVRCAGPWCARLTPGAEYLLFARSVGGGQEVLADPCATMAFVQPDAGLLRRVQSCLSGGSCVSKR
ncbi:hypothetical protein E4Z66_16350 [Aliishimia ponticola]|uniref:Uncharacterized protein n=1 Tax=Aliishimia ponticola TaxID=2499833 RepID=A0A4S4N9S0_9RHOB|nr:hypothetical protein [Aliishimia ponticola]THH35385.1 hypothetical protein E4Z66_16350 [Aliishimia ponticola]